MSGVIRSDEVGCVSKCFISAFFPPDNLLIADVVWGVGGNWMVQIWCGHGLVVDGGSHS